jgi:hypothetical protein
MSWSFTTTIRNARLTVIRDAIDAGAGAGLLRIYNGTKPAAGGAATTLLAQLTLSDPCGTVSAGVLTFSAITNDASADATGTATWARFVDSDGNWCADGTVGTSGADVNLNTTSIVAGQTVGITSAAITEGNS